MKVLKLIYMINASKVVTPLCVGNSAVCERLTSLGSIGKPFLSYLVLENDIRYIYQSLWGGFLRKNVFFLPTGGSGLVGYEYVGILRR